MDIYEGREKYNRNRKFTAEVLSPRIGTPICMEQFGWSQKDTVLYYGILLGSNGALSMVYYITAGPLSKR